MQYDNIYLALQRSLKTIFAMQKILFVGCWLLAAACSPQTTTEQTASTTYPAFSTENLNAMYPSVATYLANVQANLASIPDERKENLEEIAEYIAQQKASGQQAHLVFICTHNSRRSHLSQIWAGVAAAHFGLSEVVTTYSGGTETTAFNPRAVAAVERAGLKVFNPGGENPRYEVSFAADSHPLICYSKLYNDPSNPAADFVAIMNCSEADANCPFIPGAALRFSVRYNDPKEADNTPEETHRYDERCFQIATEMYYLMQQVGNPS